jgi:tetratricopeptide (TPR) repeat protein
MLAIALRRTPERRPQSYFSTGNLLILGLVTAIGVPVSFLAVFLDEQTIQAHRYWQEMRIVKAQRIVQRLCDVGSTRPLGQREVDGGSSAKQVDVSPRKALTDLRAGARFFEEKARVLTSGDVTDQRILELVSCYTALDKLEEAVAALKPVSQRDPWAALRLAELYGQLGRKQDCQATAERVLQTAQRVKPKNATEVQENENLQFGAYEMLVVLAGERADYAMAESLLWDAFERLPGRRADVHGCFIKHFEFIGDFTQAVAHQARAANANPEQYSPPESVWRKVLSHGAPVGLARPQSSRYK